MPVLATPPPASRTTPLRNVPVLSIVPILVIVPAAPATSIASLLPEISAPVPVLATLPPAVRSTPERTEPVPSIVPLLTRVDALPAPVTAVPATLISPVTAFHIPKTIDNDLMENDHAPGFPSAARFVAQAFMGADLDNRSLPGVYVAVVMGRNAGFLTAASSAARTVEDDGPHLITYPSAASTNHSCPR